MNVIVTGASMGIGRGIATVLARHGCVLGLLARSGDRLEAVAAEIATGGGSAHVAVCDLRSESATQATFDGLIARMGRVDALVNNAGLVIRKDVREISLDEWRDMVDTNIHGVFHSTRAVLPHLERQGSGHIINISSISGRLPLPGGSGYAATKYAVTGFSESLFHEVRDLGIKVTTVFPGSVDSESHRHDATADASWKVRPEEVGEACWSLLNTASGNCVSSLEIRPLKRPPR